ncbi:MAG: hypothetical protein KFW09_03165 [Oscillospiraceae bacterium]|nr:hypothetical protein [Oscillospiraceae bacterium]
MFKQYDIKNKILDKPKEESTASSLLEVSQSASDISLSDIELGASCLNYDSVFNNNTDVEEYAKLGRKKSFSSLRSDLKIILIDRSNPQYSSSILRLKEFQNIDIEANLGKLLSDEYHLYKRVLQNSLKMILLGTKEDIHSDNKTFNFATLTKSNRKSGSILCTKDWTMLSNDIFILGGIDGMFDIYLVSKRSKYNMESPTPSYLSDKDHLASKGIVVKLSCFARELIGILCAGYKIQMLRDQIEVCKPPKKYINMSLLQYVNAFTYFSRCDDWQHLYNPDLVGFDFDFTNNKLKGIITTNGYKSV